MREVNTSECWTCDAKPYAIEFISFNHCCVTGIDGVWCIYVRREIITQWQALRRKTPEGSPLRENTFPKLLGCASVRKATSHSDYGDRRIHMVFGMVTTLEPRTREFRETIIAAMIGAVTTEL